MPSSPLRPRLWLLFGFGVAAPIILWPVWSTAQFRPQAGRAPQTMIAPEERFVPDTPANRQLAKAAKALDLAGVRAAFAAGASADLELGWTGTDETMPVAIVAAYAEVGGEAKARPVFREIVSRVKEPNAVQGRLGNTLLMVAVELEDLPSVESLVARGAQIDARTGLMPGPMGMDGKMSTMGGETVLHRAVLIGGGNRTDASPVLRVLLDKGAPVDTADERGMTPLILAAQYGKAPVVRLLLEFGADPKLRDKAGRTALDHAMRRHFADVANLLDAKAPMDLGQAAAFGNVARLRAALDAGGDPNGPVDRGWPPLSVAAASGKVEAVRLLLDRGARVGGTDKRGLSALHIAAQVGDTKAMELLLARGADPNLRASPQDLRGEEATPLMMAVDQAHPEAVALMLRHVGAREKAQVDAALRLAVVKLDGSLSTPTGLPRQKRRWEDVAKDKEGVLERLLKAGADPCAKGSRALFLAAEQSQAGLVRLFLDKGADVNARDRDRYALEPGATALIAAIDAFAMAGGEEEMIRNGSMSGTVSIGDAQAQGRSARATFDLLLQRGADPNLADTAGKTPLMHCVEMDSPVLVPALLARKPRLEATDREAWTALAHAAAEGKLDVVRTLVAHGANVNAADAKGRTVLMLAVDAGANDDYRKRRAWSDEHMEGHGESPRPIRRTELPNSNGHPEVVRFLLAHGANPKARAKNGATALSLAKKEGFDAVATLLEKQGG